jgi:hypothetical protein
MDCQTFHQKLSDLIAIQTEFASAMDHFREAGTQNNVRELSQKVDTLQTELIATNLSKFQERYAEMIRGECGEKITGFTNDITSTLRLDDTTALVTGMRGETRILKLERPDDTVEEIKAAILREAQSS